MLEKSVKSAFYKCKVSAATTLILLTPVIVVICCINAKTANAWGHLKHLESEFGQATLSYAAVNRHQINYCIEVDARNEQEFSEQSISEQTEMALALWLKVVSSVLNHIVAVHRVDCTSSNLDLEINLAPRALFDGSDLLCEGATRYLLRGAKPHVLIQIDTYYKFNASDTIHNFKQIVDNIGPTRVSLHEAMETANSLKQQAGDIGIEANVNDDVVASSTYPVLLHEIGHGFGLCDTDNDSDIDHERFVQTCDMAYVSSKEMQPESIMKRLNFFYLTDDDQQGVTEVVKRFIIFGKWRVPPPLNHRSSK